MVIFLEFRPYKVVCIVAILNLFNLFFNLNLFNLFSFRLTMFHQHVLHFPTCVTLLIFILLLGK